MDTHLSHGLFDRLPITKSKAPAVKWFKQWVPQDVIATGGKCLVLKWVNESTLNAMKEKLNEPKVVEPEPEPEPTTEVLFLCSYESCGKTFIDAGALKKHSHIHGERQYVCHYENCGKKFLDSSKLKRHFLIHTGERHFVCPHEGCGKAFSLDFNLRSHMKTHSQENYYICPYPECGKRYAHEYKLKNHIASHHDKQLVQNVMEAPPKYTPPAPAEKPAKPQKSSTGPLKSTAGPSGPASVERPFACPYEGCEKAYIHEYKLNLHLRREHPGHFPENDKPKTTEPNHQNEAEEGSEPDAYSGKHLRSSKAQKQSKRKPNSLKPNKLPHKRSGGRHNAPGSCSSIAKRGWPTKEEAYEEDSEETEEERENVAAGGGWVYRDSNNNDDDDDDDEDEDEDEETEYED